jgi:hypothetical protein
MMRLILTVLLTIDALCYQTAIGRVASFGDVLDISVPHSHMSRTRANAALVQPHEAGSKAIISRQLLSSRWCLDEVRR